MSDLRAPMAISEAVLDVLRGARSRLVLDDQPTVRTVTGWELTGPAVSMGVTLMVHHIAHVPDNPRPPTQEHNAGANALAVIDVHFMLSMWATTASTEHLLAGWVVAALAEQPVLPAELLNRAAADCFGPDETVRILPASLSSAEVAALWGSISPGRFRLTLPYVAPGIRLELR